MRKRSPTAWGLSAVLALAGGFVIPSRAGAAPATPEAREPLHANLEVDTSGTGTGGPVIQRRIEERASVVMRRLAVLPGDGGSPTLRIIVSELEGDTPGYGLELQVQEPGSSDPIHTRSVVCSLCTETELVARAEAEVEAAIPQLEDLQGNDAANAKPEGAPAPKPGPSAGSDPVAASPVSSDDGTALRGAGIGLLTAGVSGVAVGIGLALAQPRVDRDDPRYERSTRAPGIGVLAAGAATAVAGAVLTGLGVKRRRTALAGRAELGIVVGGGRFGAALEGRF